MNLPAPISPAASSVVVLDPHAQQLLGDLPALLRDRPAAQLVTVMHVKGSAPREAGARMLCRDGRLLAGTIGGGHLEDRALREAGELAAHGHFEPVLRRWRLGPELAQCCGGVVELMIAPIDSAEAQALAAATREALRGGAPLVSEVGGRMLVEAPGPVATVVIFGAGHVGAALAQVLTVLPWRVVVIDHRPQWAEPSRFGPSVEVINQSPVSVLAAWGWLGQAAAKSTDDAVEVGPCPQKSHTYAVIMTHDHRLDRDLADALMRVDERTDGTGLQYVGVIGSKTKIALLRRRLSDRGVSDAQLDKLVAPIGLRHKGALLGGKLPGEIAISVAAQLLGWNDGDVGHGRAGPADE